MFEPGVGECLVGSDRRSGSDLLTSRWAVNQPGSLLTKCKKSRSGMAHRRNAPSQRIVTQALMISTPGIQGVTCECFQGIMKRCNLTE